MAATDRHITGLPVYLPRFLGTLPWVPGQVGTATEQTGACMCWDETRMNGGLDCTIPSASALSVSMSMSNEHEHEHEQQHIHQGRPPALLCLPAFIPPPPRATQPSPSPARLSPAHPRPDKPSGSSRDVGLTSFYYSLVSVHSLPQRCTEIPPHSPLTLAAWLFIISPGPRYLMNIP